MGILVDNPRLDDLNPQGSAILGSVCDALGRACELHRNLCDEIVVYAFGSVLSPNTVWKDVDVLLVVPTPDVAETVRSILTPISAAVPLHVIIVLPCEFEELGKDAWGPLLPLVSRTKRPSQEG